MTAVQTGLGREALDTVLDDFSGCSGENLALTEIVPVILREGEAIYSARFF